MKKLFSKTWFALLLCVIGVVASTLLNTRIKFGALCGEMREELYQPDSRGVSLMRELNDYRESFATLLELSASQGLDTAAAEEAAGELNRLMEQEKPEAAPLHTAYRTLVASGDSLGAQMSELQLGTHDSATLQRCLASLETAKAAIESFGYNADVEEFLRTYDRFPTRPLADAVGLQYPQIFA